MHHTFMYVEHTLSNDHICVQFWFCWIAVLPELDYIENGQNVIKSASSAEYASNVQMVTLQSSSKN